jgi:hypothetical protein
VRQRDAPDKTTDKDDEFDTFLVEDLPRPPGVSLLRSYCVEWDEKARAFKKTPAHNWASQRRGCVALPLAVLAGSDLAPEEEEVPIGNTFNPATISLRSLSLIATRPTSKIARVGRGGSFNCLTPRLRLNAGGLFSTGD